jgi:hypothetical protein
VANVSRGARTAKAIADIGFATQTHPIGIEFAKVEITSAWFPTHVPEACTELLTNEEGSEANVQESVKNDLAGSQRCTRLQVLAGERFS